MPRGESERADSDLRDSEHRTDPATRKRRSETVRPRGERHQTILADGQTTRGGAAGRDPATESRLGRAKPSPGAHKGLPGSWGWAACAGRLPPKRPPRYGVERHERADRSEVSRREAGSPDRPVPTRSRLTTPSDQGAGTRPAARTIDRRVTRDPPVGTREITPAATARLGDERSRHEMQSETAASHVLGSPSARQPKRLGRGAT